MGLLLSLSSELLHAIIEDIVHMYSPAPQTPIPELLALSVTNRRLRETCLPFLFTDIEIKFFLDATRLEKHIGLCSRFTKNMIIGARYQLVELAEPVIIRNLPKLKRLLNVELHESDFGVRPVLFKAMLAQPTVTSILIHGYEYGDGFAHTPPFLSTFIESLQQQDLVKVAIKRIGLRRTIGQSEWYVMGLTLIITFASNTSPKALLTLVASSFPKLAILNLYLHFTDYKNLSAEERARTLTLSRDGILPYLQDGNKARFHFINLAPVFTQFLSLKSLSLRGYIDFERNYFSKYLPELLQSSPLLNSIFSPSLIELRIPWGSSNRG
ncbi:hypothetical protein FB446DRAFT_713335 [Lentinula raphanica]|nr:hypothetical protein FB446DRAFT_713335 [Lentinula raphanica]